MAGLIRSRYEPLEVGGRGGQGEVLRALDHVHDRQVAIKVRRVGSPEERAELLSEARILLGLRPHRGLPLVREDFFVGDRYYLVMDWVEGENLQHVLESKGEPGLPFSIARRYLSEVVAALDHLHCHEPPVLHGDVKPSNIILGSDGHVVLVDFGIAGRGQNPHAKKGTRGYLAPEIIGGLAPTPASDVFGLAATTFALLTGSAPEGLRPAWEGVPRTNLPAVERAIQQGLFIDPARRPVSVYAFFDRLVAAFTEDLPSGLVTFLLTDVEGSTRSWEQDPTSMLEAMARHDALVAEAIEGHGGLLLKTRGEGDSAFAVFTRALDAAAAALRLQRTLDSEKWPQPTPIRVRVAVHTGEAELRAGDYFGATVNRAARLRSIAHGGQTVLSQATEEQVRGLLSSEVSLRDLGEHRLKDLARPEHVFQLCHPDLVDRFPPLRSLQPRQTNLPIQLTSFVGREAEIPEIAGLLAKTRLVTLTGSGGAGKTRLALHVGAESVDQFTDGVLFVELAPLSDPGLVPQALASILDVRESPDRPLIETLIDALRSKSVLLLLDNCEHVVDACAHLADGLLRACAELRILATSREPLGVPGEATFRIPSLPTPDVDVTSPELIESFDAVRLFVERAALAKPGFGLNAGNASAVAQICSRLDGIPLALELAAAGLRSLSPEEVSERLDDRFRLLTGGPRTVLPRQQTLRAAVDWSYELLSQPERVLLRRLSVFAGGFTLGAVDAVCGDRLLDGRAVDDLLRRLVDRSLVTASEPMESTRYSMLETIRQYAAERLLEAGEVEELRRRHAGWFVAFAEEAEPGLLGADQKTIMDRVEEEHDNLRQSLAWATDSGDGPSIGLRLAGALHRFWLPRGYIAEGRRWLEQALSRPGGAPLERVKTLAGAGLLAAYGHGDYAVARDFHREALEIARSTGDRAWIADSLLRLGSIEMVLDEWATASQLFEESLAIAREAGPQLVVIESLLDLASIATWRGQYEVARRRSEESLTLARSLGHIRQMGRCWGHLGRIAYAEADFEAARSLTLKKMSIDHELGDRWGEAGTRNDLAAIAFAEDDRATARSQCEQSLAISREIEHGPAIVQTLLRLVPIALAEGNLNEARALLEESLARQRKTGDRIFAAWILEEWGALADALSYPKRAARLYGAVDAIREEVGSVRPQPEEPVWRRRLDDVQSTLGSESFAEAWSEGRKMSQEAAVEYAVSDLDEPASPAI